MGGSASKRGSEENIAGGTDLQRPANPAVARLALTPDDANRRLRGNLAPAGAVDGTGPGGTHDPGGGTGDPLASPLLSPPGGAASGGGAAAGRSGARDDGESAGGATAAEDALTEAALHAGEKKDLSAAIRALQRGERLEGQSPADLEFLNRDLVPVVFHWAFGGEEVYVTGTFTDWKEHKRMRQSGNDFTYIAMLPRVRPAAPAGPARVRTVCSRCPRSTSLARSLARVSAPPAGTLPAPSPAR